MVTCETFFHPVFAASAAAEAPEVRDYASRRLQNTVDIGHELGARFAVYWPGTLGYMCREPLTKPTPSAGSRTD